MANVTPRSATMISPRLEKAGITDEIVENPWEYRMDASVPRKSAISTSNSWCTSTCSMNNGWDRNSTCTPTDSTIETCRPTAAATVFPERVNGTLLDVLVPSKTSPIEASEVRDGFPVSQLGLGTIGTADDGYRSKLRLFCGGKLLSEWFWDPFIHQLVDFL